ncbi:MAG: hypothetical protein K2Q21_10190 [Chitinophagaceae bacterium]|nr:hypothetical protein [Chitinophagaceae bacterium]
MKQMVLVVAILACCYNGMAQQKNNSSDNQKIARIEAGIQDYAVAILNAKEMIDRFRADSLFTKGLVQALKQPYSFSYSFDSLITISKLYAPDSSFRIFTWQVMKDYSSYHQKGAIQMKTADGSLKLFPLFDYSDYTDFPGDSVRTTSNWIGAVYYNIVLKTFNNKNYYTLLGYDENNARTTKKWMEVLSFDAAGKPVFGGRYFNYPPDSIKLPQPAYRFCLEFKKQASAKLNYDAELDRIVFAHLVSETGEVREKQTLIPYGSYEGFRWQNGKWVYEKNIESADPKPGANTSNDPMNGGGLQLKPKKKNSN